MEKCLDEAKQLIEKQVKNNMPSFGIHFSEYGKFFGWTNENIGYYLGLANYEGKTNALSVLASGDHVFNLITNGITNIDTFDVNRLTEYYALGLKRAMILKYNYYEFITFINFIAHPSISLDDLTDIITDLLPYMEKKHRTFWKELIDYNYKLQKEYQTNLSLIIMLCVNYSFKYRDIINNYLFDKESYERLRKRLMSANISFKCADAINLAEEFQGKYDFILLSNILDYFDKAYGKGWGYDKLQFYEEKLDNMTNPEGVIFLDYVFDYPIFVEDPIIDGSNIKMSDLKNGEEIVLLPHNAYSFGDGIILKRVK